MPRCVLSPKNCSFAWKIWTPSTTCFLGPTRVRNPNGISTGSAIFAQLTAVSSGMTFPKIAALHGESCILRPTPVHGPWSIATPVQPFVHGSRQNVIGHVDALRTSILPVPVSGPHLRRGSLSQPDLASQTTSRFRRHSSRRTVPILYNGRPISPKIAPSHRVIWTIQTHNPHSICIGSAVFAQLTAEDPYNLQHWPLPCFSPLCIRVDLP